MAFDINAEIREMGDSLKSFVTNYKGAFELLLKRVDNMEYEQGRAPARHDGGSAALRKLVDGFEQKRDLLKQNSIVRFESPSLILNARAISSSGLTGSQTYPTIGVSDATVYGGVRNLFQQLPLTEQSAFQVRETSASGFVASPQVETTAKQEASASLVGELVPAKTIASWVSASRQALQDVSGLEAFLQARLIWGLMKEADEQILFGSGTGQDLNGIAISATAFDTALLPTAYDFATVVGASVAQLTSLGFAAGFVIMNPADVFLMQFRKASDGQYVEHPALPPIVATPIMPQGSFLTGDPQGAVVRIREAANVMFSDSHEDYFARNLVAIRAEERLCVQIVSPKAFVTGNLTSSPA